MTDRGIDLPGSFLARKVRPFSLAVAVSTATVGWQQIVDAGPGTGNVVSHVVGAVAVVSVLLLIAGFWARRDAWVAFGLFLATGVWASRMFLTLILDGVTASAWFSAAWAVGAGGAWLLEVAEVRRQRDVRVVS